MADNANTLADPADNDYEDWFELYNAGIKPVDLGGYYLTDTLTNKFQFRIPSTGRYIIPPRGFLLVWADNEPGQNNTNRPDLHVNFKLDKDGEAIGLFGADGEVVDYITFGAQSTDLSMGRYPDGGANFSFMAASSPRASNIPPNTAPSLTSPGDKFVYVGQTISFTIQANDADQPPQTLIYSLDPGAPTNAAINPATGVFTWTAVSGQAAITNTITVRVTDNGVPPLSASQNFKVTAFPLPRINALTLDAFTITFTWPSLPGQSYQVEYRNELATGVWMPLGSPIAGTGDPLAITDDRGYGSHRFYRLKILP